jgi:hypothetical protein
LAGASGYGKSQVDRVTGFYRENQPKGRVLNPPLQGLLSLGVANSSAMTS